VFSTLLVPIVNLWLAHDSVENVKQGLLISRPEWGSELSDYVFFGSKDGIPAYVSLFEVNSKISVFQLFMGSLVFLLICNTIIPLFFTYLIHYELHKHKTIMSKMTLQMHRTLINILLAQVSTSTHTMYVHQIPDNNPDGLHLHTNFIRCLFGSYTDY
jgi:hypothetical protein